MQASQNSAQVFLGVNLKCAACHDSFVNKWKLKDAYGLASVAMDCRVGAISGTEKNVHCLMPKSIFVARR